MARYINKFASMDDYKNDVFALDYPNVNYIESGDTIVWSEEMPKAKIMSKVNGTVTYGVLYDSADTVVHASEFSNAASSLGRDRDATKNVTVAEGITRIEGSKVRFEGYRSKITLELPQSLESMSYQLLEGQKPGNIEFEVDGIDVYLNNLFVGNTKSADRTFCAIAPREGTVSIGYMGQIGVYSSSGEYLYGLSQKLCDEYMNNDADRVVSLSIPSSVKHIETPLNYVSALTLSEQSTYFEINKGCLIDKAEDSIIFGGPAVGDIGDGVLPQVSKIGTWAFYGMPMESTIITIPQSVTSIGYLAFSKDSLGGVKLLSTTPPTLETTSNDNITGGIGNTAAFNGSYPIYVPSESVGTYKAASGWSKYASRIQAIPTE